MTLTSVLLPEPWDLSSTHIHEVGPVYDSPMQHCRQYRTIVLESKKAKKNLNVFTMKDLRAMCKKQGLTSSGSKKQLLERLNAVEQQ